MTSQDFSEWEAMCGFAWRFVEPGEPDQDAFIDGFKRTSPHGIPDASLFLSIEPVQSISQHGRRVDNGQRPRDALLGLPTP